MVSGNDELNKKIINVDKEMLNIFKVLKSKVEVRKVHNVNWLFINNVQTMLLTETQVIAINKFYSPNKELNFSDDSPGLRKRILGY